MRAVHAYAKDRLILDVAVCANTIAHYTLCTAGRVL